MLEKLKECVKKLRAPQEMVSSIRKALVDSEIIAQGQLEGGEWDEAFLALKVLKLLALLVQTCEY